MVILGFFSCIPTLSVKKWLIVKIVKENMAFSQILMNLVVDDKESFIFVFSTKSAYEYRAKSSQIILKAERTVAKFCKSRWRRRSADVIPFLKWRRSGDPEDIRRISTGGIYKILPRDL